MKRNINLVVALIAAISFNLNIMAQTKQQFTLDDLLSGGKTYDKNVPQNKYYAWWGNRLVELNNKELTIDANSTKPQALPTSDIKDILKKYSYASSNINFTKAEFPYADRSVIKVKTSAGIALVDWEKGTAKLLKTQPGTNETDFAPASGNLAYSNNHNLYIIKSDGTEVAVSQDGCLDIVYGESVHRNEFGIEKGTFWSPSGTLLAFYRMDQSMVSTYPQVDISTRCAEMVPDKYPMAGETSHKVTVGIYNTENGKTIYLDAGDPTDRYFTNIAWSPDSKTIYMIELNRDQNEAQLVSYNAQTGQRIGILFEEKNEKYVEPMFPIQFLPWDSSKFVYISRKDGWLQLYLYNTKGEELAQLTKGNFEVIEFLGFNTKQKNLLYTSNEASPIQKNIYSVDMKGKRTLLDDGEGWHNGKASADGTFICDNYSSPTVSRKVDYYTTNGKKAAQNLLTAKEPWDKFDVPEMKVGTIKAADGHTDLYYRLVLPVNFDPNKKYPTVVYVYGGPHAHNVDASRNWGVRGWDIWMAQQGYVMFSLDNRGSEHRGLEFEQATFRQLGVKEMKDQMKGVEFLRSLPYVDSERIGVHGWSFGGFMTTSLMTTYPETFKVGVAGGPVIDWKYYEVMYGERYMDTPQTNPEGYANTSLLNKAGNLKGRLLVIYGGNDMTCVPQHTLSFVRACIDAGTYPDLFTYPGQEHNMRGQDRIHLHHKITQYFNDYLK